MPVLPASQPIRRDNPNTSIRGRLQHRNCGRGKTLLVLRNRRHCKFTKTIEAVFRADPNSSFAIFKDFSDEIAGETVGNGESIGPALVQVQQTFRGADPQIAIAAPEKAGGPVLPGDSWK